MSTAQELFDRVEEIGDALHALSGCEEALHQVLDQPLAASHDRGHAAYAILRAIAGFRAEAVRKAEALRDLQARV